MKPIALLISFLLMVLITSAQVTFQKVIGGTPDDIGLSVQQTSDGGYIIAGFTLSFGAGNEDVYLVKIGANGNLLWTKTFGGTTQDVGNSVQQTTDGGYIIVGSSVVPLSGNPDTYLIKTDANGDTLWTRTFGGINYEGGESIQQTTDGGYIIAGISGYPGNGYDLYLRKTDASGNSLWAKSYGAGDNDVAYSVEQTSDGGYITTGYTDSFGAGDKDVYLMKTDSIGNSVWIKTFGGSNDDYGRSVKQTTDGGYLIAGTTYSFGAGGSDAYLIKTDSNGNTLWTKTYGSTHYDEAASVCLTSDGGYLITGEIYYFAYLIKTNSVGDTLWTKAFTAADSDFGKSVQQTADGGYIITGLSWDGSTASDILCLKTDSLGNGGCITVNQSTIINSPTTQVTNPVVTVYTQPNLVSASTTLVGSGGMDSTSCTSVGINEIVSDNSFIVFPNPSNGNFVIRFSDIISDGIIEFYNVLGKRLYSENLYSESKKEINFENVSKGIYFVKVFDGEKMFSQKIIIQ